MTVYPLCAQAKYRELPEPFNLKAEPKVPYSLQIVIVPSYLPPDKEQDYVDIFKHIYLHKNKVSSADCVSFCHGAPVCFDWGKQTRLALAGLNNMLDRTGGMQIRIWTLAPKFEKKHTFRSECSRVWVPIHSRTWPSLEQHEPIHGMDWRTSALSRWSFGGMAGRKGEGSPSQLLSWSAKCKDDPVLAIDIEKLCGMVSRRDPCQDAPNHAAARHHMDRAYSCRKIFGLQNHSVCSIQVRDHTSWSRRSCTFHCDCQAPWFL